MAERNAPPTCSVPDEVATTNVEGMAMELMPVISSDEGNISRGSGEDESAPATRAIPEFSAPRLSRSSECSSSSSTTTGPATVTQCSQHPASQLDPGIWSRLLEELLEVVFAKLPVPEIHRLRCLSTCWRRNVVEARSRFRELCAKTSSRMLALICLDSCRYNRFSVKLYDTGTNKWHVYNLFPANEPILLRLSAADGGLVCFLFSACDRKYPLRVVVCNPLTQHVKTFGLEGVTWPRVDRLQIVTNQDTRHYKVSVIWRKHISNSVHHVAEMLDSKTEKWISLDQPLYCNLIFTGILPNWLWNCHELHLRDLINVPIQKDAVGDFGFLRDRNVVLMRDRNFVLYKESNTCFVGDPDNQGNNDIVDDNAAMPHTFTLSDHYYIVEYQRRQTQQQTNWVRLRTIRYKLPPSTTVYQVRLQACEGFLMVVAWNHDLWYNPDHIDYESAWLYDLSSNEWRALPSMPGGVKLQNKNNLLCELRWDVDVNPLNVPHAD